MANVTVDRRLWLTADKTTLVEDGDVRAAFLWAVAGREVPAGEAKRVGYTPAGIEPAAAHEPEPEPVPEPAKPRNKGGRPKGSTNKPKTSD